MLAALATLTEKEVSRLAGLKEDLSKNPSKAAEEQKLKADNIKGVIGVLTTLEALANDATLDAIFTLHRDAVTKREAARLAAKKVPHFKRS